MTRAFRASRDFKKGTDNDEFRLLEHIENGHYEKLADYPKQLARLKSLLGIAVGKVLKWKLPLTERNEVAYYATMMEQADDGDALAFATDELLEATHRLKEV